jgi:polyisoprenoid-binding protein YceI
MKTLLTLAIALLFAAPISFASTPKSAAAKSSAANAETNLSVGGTITWTGTGVGKSHTGTLLVKSGEVKMKGSEVLGGQFVLDMNSIAYSNPRLVGHLKSPDFFDVEKFPEAKFVIKKSEPIKKVGADKITHKLMGELTIKDKTQPIEFGAILTLGAAGTSAKGTILIADRTAYGINYNSKKFKALSELGDKMINDEIKLELDLTAK